MAPLDDALPAGAPQRAAPAAPRERSSYGDILKSSALIGGASLLNMLIGLVRTKVLALLLGPAGFGLIGLFTSIADVARSVVQLGTQSSGVRQIAEATASGDTRRAAQTVALLRRLSLGLAIPGGLLVVLLAAPIAELTFGDSTRAGAVALLAAAVGLRALADCEAAVLQGGRRIAELARITVYGGLLGTAVALPLVYLLGEDGVVPSLVAVAAASLAVTWWYTRRLYRGAPAMDAPQRRHETAALLKLGAAFMASALLMMASAYLVRLIVLRHEGLAAAGLYQAAWNLGGLYIAFVLQAMGSDFYPRLVGAANDAPRCNRLVNEQAQVSLLLAAPGVIATLAFAPLVLELLYSRAFVGGVDLLRWICLGMALRVITWPMGFIVVAKAARLLFFATELAWTLVSLGLAWVCVERFGLEGAGIAFFGSYLFHAAMIYPIVRRLTGFRWSAQNRAAIALFLATVGAVFWALQWLPVYWGAALGLVAALAATLHALRSMSRFVSPEIVPRRVRPLLAWFAPAPQHSGADDTAPEASMP